MNEQIKVGDKSVVLNAEWANESPLIHASLKDGADTSNVTVQYVEPISLGMRLQHYGTKVPHSIPRKITAVSKPLIT